MQHKYKSTLLRLLCFCFLLSSPVARAQMRFLVSSDVDYHVLDTPDARVIFSKNEQPLVNELLSYQRVFKDIYQREFAWQLDEKPTYILASSQNQIANGFATVFPQLHTVFYRGGPELIDEFGVTSWLYVLMSHETVHLYQLNAKSGYSRTLKEYLGNSMIGSTSFLPPFTYVLHPNIFLPTFILEGNATYNEGRFGNGGRLYNGAIRALFFSMIRNEDIQMTRLMNDNIDFPYGSEKYWVGGFFQLYLAETYGEARTNSFFIQHSEQRWNPLNLNRTFYRVFGVNYDQALNDMLKKWGPLAARQTRAPEKVLFTSKAHPGMTSSLNEISFLTSDRLKPPTLHVYNLNQHKWSHKQVNMPLGRVFRRASDKKWAAVSGEPVSSNEIRYGLFTDGYNFEKSSLNRIYFDVQGEQELWVSTTQSFRDSVLYHNNKKVGVTSSSAILGQNAEPYYFRQKNKQRMLTSGTRELFSYNGYYGFPVHVTTEEDVYFIGPSEWGSTLYLWQKGTFYRLNASDLIVDARLINPENALVVEIMHDGYQYKMVPLTKTPAAPFEYQYFYEGEPAFQTFSQLSVTKTETQSDTSTPAPAETAPLPAKDYSGIKSLQYNGLDPFLFYGTDTAVIGGLGFRFSDPLQHHFLTFTASSGSFGERAASFQYLNATHLLNWNLAAVYQKRAKVEEDPTAPDGFEVLDQYDAWLGDVGIALPFYRRPQWNSVWDSHFIYENEDPNILIDDIDQKFTWLNQLNLTHNVSSSLGYQAYRTLHAKIGSENVRSTPDWQAPYQIYGAEALAQQDLYHQTYFSLGYQAVQTDGRTPVIELESSPDDLPYPTVTRLQRNTPYPSRDYFSVQKVSAEIKQAFNYGLYFKKLPASFRRIALFGAYHEYYGALREHHDAPDTLFHEVGGGTEFELLLLHRFPLRVRVAHYKSSYTDDGSTLVVLGM